MLTIVQTFQIVENNNFDDLLIIINSDKKFNFNILNKNGVSLLYIAVKYRARECFNLLIKQENLTILNSLSYYINPIHIALEYYVNGRNHVNKYYLDKLLEHNVTITILALKKAMNNAELFNILFLKVINKLSIKDYMELLEYICVENKLNILEYIYEVIDDESKILNINKILFKYSICNDNICIINYLEKYNFNFKLVDSKPSLYFALNYSSQTEIFNFIFNYYKSQTREELETIENIYTLDLSYNLLINVINKYLLLDLDFEKVTINLLKKALSFTNIYDRTNYENLMTIIYIILKNKKINLVFNNEIVILHNSEQYLIKLFSIIQYFKISINKSILTFINSKILNQKYYEESKKKYLNELEKNYNNIINI